jgi:hypothetical protein
MMLAIFLAMTLALLLGHIGRSRLAVACLFVSLALAAWLFLFEVYSPDYGFRMPWLIGQLDTTMGA